MNAMNSTKPVSVEEYISSFPVSVQNILQEIRRTILEVAPQAEECISYAMPAFKIGKQALVYFAGFKNHIGFYALPEGNVAFQDELANYKTGKGSIQFPLSDPMPLELIRKIVEFRVKEVESLQKPQGK